jgi:predicted RNase H-like nuclease
MISTDRIVGVDGCRAGWVVATRSEQAEVRFRVVTDIAPTFQNAAYVAIDIPIGLPNGQARGCDLAARRTLGSGQGSRVFPAPSRAAFAGNDYAHCCALNEAVMGVRLSKQAFAIMPKIAEVDRLMTPALQARVREAHPEVSFCILNGTPLVHGKKSAAGQQERLAILRRHGL